MILLILFLGQVNVDGYNIDKHEADIVQFTNDYRISQGRKPLKVSQRLMGLARLQSWHMTRRGMNHGYTQGWQSENIAAGQQSAREAVNAWINSSRHRANMLGNWTYIGVGGYDTSWTQQFSR